MSSRLMIRRCPDCKGERWILRNEFGALDPKRCLTCSGDGMLYEEVEVDQESFGEDLYDEDEEDCVHIMSPAEYCRHIDPTSA